MKQKIIFFGSGWFVTPVIEKLSNFDLSLVVTNETSGRVVEFCRENNIPFVSSNLKDRETVERIKNLKPTVAILASYGAFIPDEVIGIFQNGIINIHPSLLPKWKGPSPIPYTLLNGETTTGVTLIKLDDQIDHGPILAQQPYNLQGNESSDDLLSILFEIGSKMVVGQINQLETDGVLSETPQNHSDESWSYKIEKKDGMINLTNPPSKEKLDCMIRSYYPWPGVWFTATLKNQTKIVKLLPEEKIQVEGKNPTNYKDFVNGFGDEGREILERLNLL